MNINNHIVCRNINIECDKPSHPCVGESTNSPIIGATCVCIEVRICTHLHAELVFV